AALLRAMNDASLRLPGWPGGKPITRPRIGRKQNTNFGGRAYAGVPEQGSLGLGGCHNGAVHDVAAVARSCLAAERHGFGRGGTLSEAGRMDVTQSSDRAALCQISRVPQIGTWWEVLSVVCRRRLS